MAKNNVREQMIRGAVELLATRGVQGTSFSDVLAHTGAPRGSIYHHFPGGKGELVRAAANSIGEGVAALLDAIDSTSPAEVIDAFVDGWRSILVAGGFEQGCAVAATCLGSSESDELRKLADDIFTSWREALSRAFVRSGTTRRHGDDLAAICLATVEGALVIGRAAHDDSIFDVLKRQLHRLATL
jgi:AcrR family transcriptional regulator